MGIVLPGNSDSPEDHDDELIPEIGGSRPRDTSRWTVVAFLRISGRPDTTKPRRRRGATRRLAVATALAGVAAVVAVTVRCGPAEALRLVACAGNFFLTYVAGS